MLVAGVVDEEEPIQVRTFYLPALDVESLSSNDKPLYDPGMTEPYQVRTCSVRQKKNYHVPSIMFLSNSGVLKLA